jgi:hypothetical protein
MEFSVGFVRDGVEESPNSPPAPVSLRRHRRPGEEPEPGRRGRAPFPRPPHPAQPRRQRRHPTKWQPDVRDGLVTAPDGTEVELADAEIFQFYSSALTCSPGPRRRACAVLTSFWPARPGPLARPGRCQRALPRRARLYRRAPQRRVLPLYRLRYIGSASIWGFAIYLASRDGCEGNILPAGSPEEALDCVCGLYLNDPTGWSLPPTT